jgi:hypothetical protein
MQTDPLQDVLDFTNAMPVAIILIVSTLARQPNIDVALWLEDWKKAISDFEGRDNQAGIRSGAFLMLKKFEVEIEKLLPSSPN